MGWKSINGLYRLETSGSDTFSMVVRITHVSDYRGRVSNRVRRLKGRFLRSDVEMFIRIDLLNETRLEDGMRFHSYLPNRGYVIHLFRDCTAYISTNVDLVSAFINRDLGVPFNATD